MKSDNDSANNNSDPSQSQLINLLNYFQNNQFDLALKKATDLSEQFPNHPFAWTVLGAVFNQTGKLDKALYACQKAAMLEPRKAEVHNNLGNTLLKLGMLEEAEKSCRQAIDLEPKNALHTHQVFYNLVMKKSKALHWFRQDLRMSDNPALYEASKNDNNYAQNNSDPCL